MTKTEALRIAKRSVTMPLPWGHGIWTFAHPYHLSDPSGPSEETKSTTYSMAMAHRRIIVTRMALALMGIQGDGVERQITHFEVRGLSAYEIVSEVAALYKDRS